MDTPSTMTPAQVANAMVAAGVMKHRTRLDKIFFKSASLRAFKFQNYAEIIFL
jgi:hypothetical protein